MATPVQTYLQDGRPCKIVGKLFGVQRRRHEDNLAEGEGCARAGKG